MKNEPSDADVERRISEIYREARDYIDTETFRFNGEDLGFRVLYGPPVRNAPYLFLGFQPGGRLKDVREAHHVGWPDVCEYALDKPGLKAAGWSRLTYATNMQAVWSQDLLRDCTGLNDIFFRAPNIDDWNNKNKLAPTARLKAEAFSRPRAREIVELLSPQRIVVVGLTTFKNLMGEVGETVCCSSNGALVRRGSIWSVPAYGVKHLSGARPTKAEIETMRAWFQNLAADDVRLGHADR